MGNEHQTDKQTNRHVNSVNDLAQRAESVNRKLGIKQYYIAISSIIHQNSDLAKDDLRARRYRLQGSHSKTHKSHKTDWHQDPESLLDSGCKRDKIGKRAKARVGHLVIHILAYALTIK